MNDGVTVSTTVRAAGFVSAVLLVVLLSTSGWPDESTQLAARVQVSSCESCACESIGVSRHKAALLLPVQADVRVELPRVVSRQRRVDRWGLPPPRAPAA